MKIVTLNEIHHYIQNFMRYKMIYFSSHKFAFSNLHFSPFYEHFRQLREKYAFKLKIKYIMLIGSLRRIWWCTYIWLFLKKTLHSTPHTPIHYTPLHWTIQNILFAANPFHCFFAKSQWDGKKLLLFLLPIMRLLSITLLRNLINCKTYGMETKIHMNKIPIW